MSARTKRWILILALGLLVLAGVQLQYGLLNWGQEFGTYGHYNRVLRVVRSMDGYTLVDSRLTRRLDWRNLGHLDRFSVSVRNTGGTIRTVEFIRGSPEMSERDTETLERIIKAQFGNQPADQDRILDR